MHSTKVIKCLVIMGIISLALGLLGVLVKVYEAFSDDEETDAAMATKSHESTQNEPKTQTDQTDMDQNTNKSQQTSDAQTMISAEDAAKIALSRTNGHGRVKKIKLEEKEGVSIYLVELEGKGLKAKIGVDPYTSKIVFAEIDKKHAQENDD